MADDVQKPISLKKSFLKKDNEEDPIIVVQRFLNIFRQLHIFTTERKEAFNTMILELPMEIRGMFSSLPGGSLLQDYVNDLEQKAGISRDQTAVISSDISEEISKAKILATALAEAQIAAASKIQQTQVFVQEQAPLQNQRAETFQESRTNPASRFVADASFAKEIGSAVKEAIMYTESTRKKESEEIAKLLIASQDKLAQIVMQNNSSATNNSSNNNANNIQINTAATFPPIEEMVSGIVRAQSELFREMAKTQTAELSAIISVALKESQQLSTQTIVEAIKAFQKENLKILELKAATKYYEEDDDITPPVIVKKKKAEVKDVVIEIAEPEIMPEVIEEIAEPEIMPEVIEEIAEPEIIPEIIEETAEPEIMPEIIEETAEPEIMPEAPKKKKKKKKKKKNINASEDLNIALPNISSPETRESIVNDNIDELLTESSDEDDEWAWEYEEVLAEEVTNKAHNSNLDISLFDSELNEIKDNNLNIDLSLFGDDTTSNNKASETEDDGFEWAYEEVEAKTEDEADIEAGTEIKPTIVESKALDENEEDWEWETVEETIEEAPDPIDNIILAEEIENITKIDINFEIDEDAEKLINEEETISNQTSSLMANKFGYSNKEDNDDSFSFNSNDYSMTSNLNTEPGATEDDNFDFFEDPKESEIKTEQSLKAENINVTEEPEWEWEYEPTEEVIPVEPVKAIEIEPTQETISSETEEEWEWEYETAEEVIPVEPVKAIEIEPTQETISSETEEEWEWEYEPTEEVIPVEPVKAIEIEPAQETTSSETEEEWEWEYETADEETPVEPIQAENSSNQQNLTNSFDSIDPYQHINIDKQGLGNQEIATTNMSAIYTGEVYFQEDILSTEQAEIKETKEIENLLNAEIGIPELNNDDNNEPYKPKII